MCVYENVYKCVRVCVSVHDCMYGCKCVVLQVLHILLCVLHPCSCRCVYMYMWVSIRVSLYGGQKVEAWFSLMTLYCLFQDMFLTQPIAQ